MIMSKKFVLLTCECAIVLMSAFLIDAQSGFISIDCGTSETYTDETTGITYVSDAKFIDAGESHEVKDAYKLLIGDEKQLWNVRSFPQGTRNCYTLNPSNGKGKRYLIRARFMYGNYDGENRVPEFDLHIGVDLWDTIVLKNGLSVVNKEIIHVPLSDVVHVCLVNTGFGVPFISVLELRPLNNKTYVSEIGTSLQLSLRLDFASATNRTTMRYQDDVYDRLWAPANLNLKSLNVSLKEEKSMTKNIYELPLDVMSNAFTPNNDGNSIGIIISNLNISSKYLFFMHFAELDELETNQTREFDIFINGSLWYGPLAPMYLSHTTIFDVPNGRRGDSEGKILVEINKTQNSTLPPLVNAMEMYLLMELLQEETDQNDVDAILDIKRAYEVKRNSWQGDPCAPMTYLWDGLNCSYDNPHRITSLDLSSSGLVEISPFIANLVMLKNLDLSNNNLTGTIPEFLAELSLLSVLNLKGNNLQGPLPSILLERIKNGLSLSVDDNVMVNQDSSSPTNETSSSSSLGYYWFRMNKFGVPLFSTIGSGVVLYFVL